MKLTAAQQRELDRKLEWQRSHRFPGQTEIELPAREIADEKEPDEDDTLTQQ